jgi:hypothetical protein
MADNISARSRDRQFKKEVVPGVRKGGPPTKEYFLKIAQGEEIIEKAFCLGGGPAQKIGGTKQNSSVLEEKRDGDDRLDVWIWKSGEKGM